MYRRNKDGGEELKVFVEEDHHHVLYHIFRCVGSKIIPVTGNVMLHFDSHPDLLLPKDITDPEVKAMDILNERLSIENWILPAVYLGIIDTVVWICPPWSHQIPPGQYTLKIGRTKDQKVKVTCCQPYFLGEGIVCRESELEESRQVSLIVQCLDETFDPRNLSSILNKPYILDIDLDFFSTRNPFKHMYQEADFYQTLKKIYVFDSSFNDITDPDQRTKQGLAASEQRKELIDKLEDLTNHLQDNQGQFDGYDGIGKSFVPQLKSLKNAIEDKCSDSGKVSIDWRLVHDAGCTCDDTELPHHVSTKEEIRQLMERVTSLLYAFKTVRPLVATVARSSLDDFCPPEDVEFIQENTLDILQSVFGKSNCSIYKLYDDCDD